MAFSLGQRGDAPKAFARTTSRGVPRTAITVSVLFGFLAVFFNYKFPDTVFLFLVNSSGAVALFVYLLVAVAQLRMRRQLEREAPERLTLRMWGYPWLTWLSIVVIVAIIASMGFVKDVRSQLVPSLIAIAVAIVVGLVRERRGPVAGAEATARAQPAGGVRSEAGLR
jgi:L-asparagine transporter-like permease